MFEPIMPILSVWAVVYLILYLTELVLRSETRDEPPVEVRRDLLALVLRACMGGVGFVCYATIFFGLWLVGEGARDNILGASIQLGVCLTVVIANVLIGISLPEALRRHAIAFWVVLPSQIVVWIIVREMGLFWFYVLYATLGTLSLSHLIAAGGYIRENLVNLE